MAVRVRLCMQLDPLPSCLASGKQVHRHCYRPAGHEGMCQSRDQQGDPVHEWAWAEVVSDNR